jgi:hypothetical protein
MAYSYKDLYDLYKDDKKVDNVPQSGGAYTFDVLSDIYGAGVTDDNEDYASQLFDPKNVENYKAKQIESDAINQKTTPKDESIQDYEENQENSGIFGKIKNLFSKSKKKYEDLKEPEINISEQEYTYYTPLVLERLNNINKELSEYEKRLQERSPGLKLLDFLSGKGKYNPDAWGEKGEKKDFKTILKESKEDSENFKKEIKTKTQEYKEKDKTFKGEVKNILGNLNENKYSQGLIVPQDQAEETALISEKMKYAEEVSNFLAREDVKTGFWDGLKHSIQEGRFVPFAYNVGQNARMGNMQEVLGKLTDEEREVLDIRAIREKYQGTDELSEYELSLLENMQIDLINSRVDKGIPYGLGESLVDMGRYGLEFAMLGGVAKGITTGAKAIKPIAKILPKSRANSFVSKLAGEMTQTLVQTGINVPAVENKTLEYTLPQHDLVAGENGDMLLKQVSEGDDLLTAFTKGFASVYVETFSEKVGGLITRREAGQVYRTITKRLGLVVKNPENFIQKSVIGRVLSKRNDKTLTVFGEYLKKSGFNGVLQEIFEEEFNEPFQAMLDSREYNDPITTPEGRTRLIMEAIGIGMYGGLLKIPDKTVNQIYKWRDKRQPKPIDIPIEEDEKIPEENLPEVIKEELQNLQQEENVPDELAGIEDIIATDGVTEGVEDGEFDVNELNELEGGPVENDVQEVTESLRNDVTPESDIFQEYNDTESGYFEDEFIGKGTFKEAIDNIGGPDNVERRTIDRTQIKSSENVSLDTERGQRALEEIKSGKRVPIVARPTGPNTFEVEDGNHRLKAYAELRINDIPIITTKIREDQAEVPEGIAVETKEEETTKKTAEQVATELIENYVKRGDDMSSLHSLGKAGPGYRAEVKKDMILIQELNGEEVDIRFPLKKIYNSIKQNEETSQESKKEPVKEKQKKPAKKKNYFGDNSFKGQKDYPTFDKPPLLDRENQSFYEEGSKSNKPDIMEMGEKSSNKSSDFVKGEMNKLKALRKEQLDLRKLKAEGKIDDAQLLTRWREIDKEVQEGLDYMEQMEMGEKIWKGHEDSYKLTRDEFVDIGLEYYKKTDKEYKETKDKGWFERTTRNDLIASYNQLVLKDKAGTYRDKAKLLDIDLPETFSSKLQEQSLLELVNNSEKLINEYIEKFTKPSGNIHVNGDNAKTLFTGYTKTGDTHFDIAGGNLAKLVYRKALELQKDDIRNILFSSGGPGSGKSSVTDDIQDLYSIYFDSNLGNMERGLQRIDEALAYKKRIDIMHINRDATDAFVDGVLKRFKNGDKRTVPVTTHVNQHIVAIDVMKELVKRFNKSREVKTIVFNNNLGYKKHEEVDPSYLDNIQYDKDSLINKLNDHVRQKYNEGELTKDEAIPLLGGEENLTQGGIEQGARERGREDKTVPIEQEKEQPEPVDQLQLKKDIMGELLFELSHGLEANPGKMRTGNGDTIDYKWYGARSFYPSWVPEHLHDKKVTEAVLDKLNSDNPKLIKLRKDSKAEEMLNLYKAEARRRYREKMYQLGYGAEEPTSTNPLEGIEDDIPLDLAIRAHEGTSYSPEKRGQSRVDEYIDIMKSDYELLKKYADTKEKVNQLNEMFERYREGYKKRTLDMLSSHSRIVSSMISGPARFPTSTMRKRNDSYDNKVRESIEYRDKVLAKIKNTLNPTTSAVISQSDPDALVKLKERLKALEGWHEKMVQINKIVRSGKDIEQKLEKLELSEKIKDQILIKGGELNNGIPAYVLRNNKGKIKQVRDRITRLEKIKSIEPTETPFDGGKIFMNTEEARLQILFDSKPDSTTRDKLKKNAFRWSPKNQAWQRQLTMNAIRATEQLFNIQIKRGKVKPISSSVDASIGMYAKDEDIPLNFTPEEITNKMLDHVPPSIQMPEMANIFRQLTNGNFIEIRNKMGRKLGFHRTGTIKMLGKLFIDERQATKILAHEIGHLIDYLPTKTMKRGNLLGRLATLSRYMKGKLINEEKQKKVESLVDERIKFQEKRRDIKELRKKTNAGPRAYKAEDTQSLKEIKRINKEIKELQKDAVYNKTVTAELKNLTVLWRPFDIDADESYTNYRFSAKELYADAISVLFVRPDILKAKAPTFLKTFLAFAYKKPNVFNALLETYDVLYKGPEAIGSQRNKKFMEMIASGEDIFTAKIAEVQDSRTGLKFLTKYLLLDENQAVIDKVNELKKKGVNLSADENPIHALESNNYVDAKIKAFLEKFILPIEKRLTKADVTWEQLGEILFLERVRDERGGLVTLIDLIEEQKPQIADLIIETLSHIQDMTVFEQYTYLENHLPAEHWAEIKSILPAGIANPLGYTTTSAKEQLKYLKGFYSAEKWDQLTKAKEEFRLANKEIIRRAKDVGYYTPELIEKMESNDSYATFQVIEYLDLYVSPAVRGQKGTFKDIANPAISTIMKNVSIITAIERNETKKKIIGMLSKHFPKDIEKARTKWIGKGHMILDTKEVGKGTIKLVVNGKLEGFNVDKYIANTVNIMNNDTLVKMGALLSIPNKFYRPVFTSLNLGFQSFNFVRDFTRYWKNVPDDTLAGALTSLPRAFYRYAQAAPSAWGRASNKPDKLIAEMDELGILGVTWNDMFNNPDKADVQIDRILVKADLKAISPRKKQKLFIRPFAKVLNAVETLGNFIETLPKVAGYIELKGKMPDAELARFLRTRVGSPDFRRKGAATPVTNNLFLFSNAIKEGWRADLASATDPKTRAGWAWKTMLVSLMPKLLMFLIAKGWLGEELEKMMNDASEYDKTNYVMVPIGRAKNGKTEFLRIPQDETGRFLGGLFWKGLNFASDDDVNLQDLFNILDYGAGQFPSVSPIFTGAGATISYLSGRNPYDSFRGRNVIPDDEFNAGPKYSAPIFLEWLIQNQGAGMILPNINALRDVEITNLEKVINAPILANTLGRWIKVTDQGRREAEYEPVLDERQSKAVEKLEKEKSLEGYVAQFLETDRSESEMNYYIRLFTEEELGPGPYKGTVKAQATNLKKSFMKEYFYRTGEKQLSTLKSLGSNAEKRAYINSVKYNMTEEEFEVFLNEALKAKFISENVYNEF